MEVASLEVVKDNHLTLDSELEVVRDNPTLLFAALARLIMSILTHIVCLLITQIPRLLVRPAAKVVILLFASALLSLGVWSAANLDTEFKAEWLVDMESSFGR